MVIASFFALALAAAAGDGAVATAPAARAETPVTGQAQPAGTAANTPDARRDPDIPTSAPIDDYGFVAWCHGALSGHMELHDRVKAELDKVSPGDDTEQTQAGQEYLALYSEALKEAEKASPNNIHDHGVEANAAGYRIWSAARAAEPRTQMWSYLMWELPPRCEIAAKRLEERSSLMAEALRPAAGAPPAPAPPPEPAPAPETSDGLRGSASPAPSSEPDRVLHLPD